MIFGSELQYNECSPKINTAGTNDGIAARNEEFAPKKGNRVLDAARENRYTYE